MTDAKVIDLCPGWGLSQSCKGRWVLEVPGYGRWCQCCFAAATDDTPVASLVAHRLGWAA